MPDIGLIPISASEDIVYYGYKSVRNWNIPGGDNTVVFIFTTLFGATIWFLARGIWLTDQRAKRRNLVLALSTFVAAILLALAYAPLP